MYIRWKLILLVLFFLILSNVFNIPIFLFFSLSLSTHTEIFLLQINWFPLCLVCSSYGVDVKMLLEHTADHRMLYILCRVCCEHTLYSFFAILHILLCSFFSFPFLLFFFTLFESKPIKAKKPTGYSATIRQRCIHIHILREFVGIILSSSKSIQFSCDRHRVCVCAFFSIPYFTQK